LTKSTKYDICIVGAGVAGSALASYLSNQGLTIAIIDQNWEEPDEIIGELLQPSGALKLREMGLADFSEGFDAQPIKGYGLYLNGDSFNIPYSDQKDNDKTGYGFRYGRFVQKLRSYLKDKDHIHLINGKVIDLIYDGAQLEGVIYQDKLSNQKKKLKATLTILSQGSSVRLTKDLTKAKIDTKGFMLGLILENCELPYPNHGHVIIAKPGPILAYPVTSNKIRVLIDFPKYYENPRGMEMKTYLREKIGPQIPEIMRKSFYEAVEKENYKTKPTCLLPAKPILIKGAILLGDSLNQRHPTTGGGMTVALTDVKALGDLIIKNSKKGFEKNLGIISREFYESRYKENATINILAYALYSVFRHPVLSKACFDYLQRGGKFALEPMSILSGLSRDRKLLIRHFFMVAWFAVKNMLKPKPTLSRIGDSIKIMRDAIAIIVPLLLHEKPAIYSTNK